MSKITKRIISAILALVLTFSVLTVMPFAANADIAVKAEQVTYLQGETFKATIYFPSKCNKVAALDLQLKYDKAKLELVSMEKGDGLEKAIDAQINGKVYSENSKVAGVISWTLAGTNNFDFSGDFAVITFKVRSTAANGKTTLDLVVNNAANSGYVDLTSSFAAADAEFDIVRNSINDFVFELNSDRSGYIVKAYQCNTVSELVIPSEYKDLPVVGIANGVFDKHVELVKITLPEHLEYIGDNAFSNCIRLVEISIPDTVTSIGVNAFSSCSALEKVKLPLGLKKIEANTFYSCIFLDSIEIPFNVTEIDKAAFYNCIVLRSVKISKNTTKIAGGAFGKCSAGGIEFTTVEGNTYLPTIIGTEDSEYPNSTIKFVEDISLGKASTVDKLDYTGAPLTPEVKVELTNGKAVVKGTDYNVVYVNNVRAGTAKVYVVGIDGYGEGYNLEFEVYCDHANIKKTVVKKATCTEDGYFSCKCQNCGKTSQEKIPATGHPSGEWVFDKRPTYNKTGIKHRVCTVCNAKYDLNTVAAKVVPDVDESGKVDSVDALLVLQHTVGKEVYVSPNGLLNADPTGDGAINSTDALVILKITVGKITLD